MRTLFFLILVLYLLAQTPLGKKYVSRYYKKTEVYVQRFLQSDSLPLMKKLPSYKNKTIQYSKQRRAESPHNNPIKSRTTQYSGERKSEESQNNSADDKTTFDFSHMGSSTDSGQYSHY